MRSFDVIFLGIGPISSNFASNLMRTGKKVGVISDLNRDLILDRFSFKNDIEIFDWESVQNQQIEAHSLYVTWRAIPSEVIGRKTQSKWLESSQLNVERIIHLSSASVYKNKTGVFTESQYNLIVNQPINAKQLLEEYLRDLNHKKNAKLINYRLTNVYGDSLGSSFIDISLNRIRNNESIEVFAGPDLVRDYLYYEDLNYALNALHGMDLPEQDLNISTGIGVSTSKLIELFQQYSPISFKIKEKEMDTNLLATSILDCSKLEALIDWEPKSIEKCLPALMSKLVRS
jgi:nucleoside-diphosphate-sugar epimerase